MSVLIDIVNCVGCGQCADICPGNLIRTGDDGKAYLAHPEDCWDCMSCMKVCRKAAVKLSLPIEFGGNGGVLRVKQDGRQTYWMITRKDGQKTVLTTDTNESNKY